MEWLAQYAEFGLVNEQKLALVFVREVGAIDNATYRQLDSSITHARVRLEIHKLCDLGFLEKKGQSRNTYYIRTSKVVSLGERLRPQDERLLPQHGILGEKIPHQHGTLGEKIPPQHGTFGKKIPPQHGTLGEKIQSLRLDVLDNSYKSSNHFHTGITSIFLSFTTISSSNS